MYVLLQYYAFTLFAMMLNELHEGQESKLAPTDCRLRPDMRKMEEADIGRVSFKDIHPKLYISTAHLHFIQLMRL